MATVAAVGNDLVVLHQLKRGKLTPCISPFALKLETYLRMAGIPYQVNLKLKMCLIMLIILN
jgi:hypothetical protein